MNELDRTVAVKVMGEPEPPPGTVVSENWTSEPWWDRDTATFGGYRWRPLPFSSNYEYAMKAALEVLGDDDMDFMVTYDAARDEPWWVHKWHEVGKGLELSEAICNLLLTLAKLEKEKHGS